MSGNEIRRKYLEFFEGKGHAIVPSAALVPENDPTTLFTGSGMQPMLPYLLGQPHPKGTRIADSQKAFRADDIEEVGDNRHTTFFEMLGNWSFGDYFKEEQISWMFEFLTKVVGLDPQKLYFTVFAGDEKNNLPKDDESVAIWQRLLADAGVSHGVAHIGSEADGGKCGMKEGERIFYYEAKKNWWSRAGVPEKMPAGEPGGPDTEMFYDFGTEHDTKYGEHCHPNCDCGRFIEIGNNVFMEYVKNQDGTFSKLPQKNVDFGGGLERIAAAAIDTPDVFKIDLLDSVVQQIEKLSGKKYEDNLLAFRVITDHMRGATFMIGEGIYPSNTEQGYFVRRLLRRSVRYADVLGIPAGRLKDIVESVIAPYQGFYPNVVEKKQEIMEMIAQEETQFRKTLAKGLKVLSGDIAKTFELGREKPENIPDLSMVDGHPGGIPGVTSRFLTGKWFFYIYQTFGFPLEMSLEEIEKRGIRFNDFDVGVIEKDFKAEFKKHQETSRAGAEHKFKGGLADHSEKVVQYHTATHLLLAALRKELGNEVHQAGSNITGERLRFDFTYPKKVEKETLAKLEEYVNDAIKAGAKVTIETMKKADAENDPTVEGSFWDRYPDEVTVYTVSDDNSVIYSRELCGGPHVENTSALNGTFKITSEESSSAGVRRIKAILE
ncbi:alanine--tRNA ligase [Candidatus Kaiserbacteria bacterium]|nr:alanine--tRNA ligase [Candidatus Kaiserbacteria bacterium]